MMEKNDFRKFAISNCNVSGTTFDKYQKMQNGLLMPKDTYYVNPSIIEERQLNVASMDVFSRLMMDRIIFLGTEIDDYVANVIQAQLLYLSSQNPEGDISIYLNNY